MIALFKQPGKAMQKVNITNNLKTLQSLVEGNIESLYPFAEKVCLLFNEDGKSLSLQPNVALAKDKKLYDYIAGNIILVGLAEDGFSSIEQSLIPRCLDLFNKPLAKCILGTQIMPVIYTGTKIL